MADEIKTCNCCGTQVCSGIYKDQHPGMQVGYTCVVCGNYVCANCVNWEESVSGYNKCTACTTPRS